MAEPRSERTVQRGTSVRFTYTGEYNALLEHLLEYTIIDLDIAEAPLDEVFMRFYGTRIDASGDGGDEDDA